MKKEKPKIFKKKEARCMDEEESEEQSERNLEKNRHCFQIPSEKVLKETEKLREKIGKNILI